MQRKHYASIIFATLNIYSHKNYEDPTTSCSQMSFFGGIRDSNPRPCIYYTLSLPTELSSRVRSQMSNPVDNSSKKLQ
jgi:hypothetical protein